MCGTSSRFRRININIIPFPAGFVKQKEPAAVAAGSPLSEKVCVYGIICVRQMSHAITSGGIVDVEAVGCYIYQAPVSQPLFFRKAY